MIRFLRRVAPGLLAGLLALAAVFGQPARAQENPIFFGKWRSFADDRLTLTLWPGAFQHSGQPVVKYRVVRDMGDRVLLLKWPPFQREFVNTPTGKGYSFYLLHVSHYDLDHDYWKLEYGFCGTDESTIDRFPVNDDEKLWAVLLTKNYDCALKDGGRKFGFGWGRLYYLRKKATAK